MANWRRRSNQPKTDFENIFDKRVDSMYAAMVAASTERKDKNGRIMRQARPIPFTRLEFAGWVLMKLGNRRDGVAQCVYCREWLNIKTISPDHEVPKAAPWNGSLDLSNLVPCCKTDQIRKSKMSGDGYRKLIEFSLTLDPRDASDMMSRLAMGGGYRPLMNRFQTLAGKKKAQRATGPTGLF